jgi:hypothetical protein
MGAEVTYAFARHKGSLQIAKMRAPDAGKVCTSMLRRS